MQFDWWTFALQAINFTVLVWLLAHFLFRPVKEIIGKRKALAEQALADARNKMDEAEAARKRLEADQASLAAERQGLLKKLHGDIEAEKERTLADARTQADALLAEARKSIADERRRTLKELQASIAKMAADMAATLLRGMNPSETGQLYLGRLEAQLKDLAGTDFERLRNDLNSDLSNLTIVTAAPLDNEAQTHWGGRFATVFGQSGTARFESDPAILGGAELRLPHAVLKQSWADQLSKAEELIQKNELPE